MGIGQRGLQHLQDLWTMQREGRVEIVALCDAFEGNLDEHKIARYVPGFQMGAIRTYSGFDQMLVDVKPDVLYFCIPPGLHDGQVVSAARAGIHLFVEKPMSLYMDEAIQMDQAIRSAGVVATAGFQLRYAPQYEAAHHFLKDKRLVMITHVGDGGLESHSVKHTHTEALGGPGDRVWAKSLAWSGSYVVEAGIHHVDLMRYWGGSLAWVEAVYVDRDPDDIEDGGDNPYAYSVRYGFKKGGIANLILSRLRKVFRGDGFQNILWDHGHLKFEGNEVAAYTYEGPYPPETPPTLDQIRHVVPLPAQTADINRTFIDAVATGDPGRLRSTFASSMNSLAAVLAANASHRLDGRRIDLEAFMTAPEYAAFRRKRT